MPRISPKKIIRKLKRLPGAFKKRTEAEKKLIEQIKKRKEVSPSSDFAKEVKLINQFKRKKDK